MKAILCPTDFSKVSLNGLEYAAQMAKALQASLTLLYVRTSIWPEAIQLERDVNESNEDIRARLELFSSEVHKEFGIPCHFHFEPTTLTFEEAVAAFASNFDLIVIGTNGADNYYQYVFGSNSFHVVEKSKCPVLIIPKNYSFHPVNLMVYAYDPETNPIFLIEQLKKLAIPLGVSVKVLHIAKEAPPEDVNRKMEILQEAVEAREPKNISWSFHFQYADEVSWALHQYMQDHNGDMLALSFHHRCTTKMT